ncbi:MAG: WYL domain-containing protein [Candidatus Margulisiibacteriota bacterium]
MLTKDIICMAIKQKKVLQFRYHGRVRVVEPHQLGFNPDGHIALGAYLVRGFSASKAADRWRKYVINEISSVSFLNETFDAPRPGYKKAPNEFFDIVICQL